MSLPKVKLKVPAANTPAPTAKPAPTEGANVPSRIATIASGTGHTTADAVGQVSEALGKATTVISEPAGLAISAGGVSLEVGVNETTDRIVDLIRKIGGGVAKTVDGTPG